MRQVDTGEKRTKTNKEVRAAYSALEKIELAEQLIDEKIAVLLEQKRECMRDRIKVYSILKEAE